MGSSMMYAYALVASSTVPFSLRTVTTTRGADPASPPFEHS